MLHYGGLSTQICHIIFWQLCKIFWHWFLPRCLMTPTWQFQMKYITAISNGRHIVFFLPKNQIFIATFVACQKCLKTADWKVIFINTYYSMHYMVRVHLKIATNRNPNTIKFRSFELQGILSKKWTSGLFLLEFFEFRCSF